MAAQLSDITSGALGYARGLGGVWVDCAELEAVNWTPWWGGDHEAKVRDPNTLRVTSLPRSETLKGVLRWVLRAALNAHLDTDIETLDEILAPVYGGVIRKGRREEHLDSLVRITVEPVLDENCDKQAVRGAAALVQRRAAGSAYQLLGRRRNDYTKVLAVTRVELQFLGKNPQEHVALLPVSAGCLQLRIRVELAENRLDGLNRFYSSPPTPAEICVLTVAALIYALSVKGVGRGANRGFGRFKVTGLRVNQSLVDTTQAEQLRILAVRLVESAGVEQALHQAHKMLVELAAKLATCTWRRPRVCGGCAPSLRPVNRVQHGVLANIVKLARHPAPVPVRQLPKLGGKTRIIDVYDALSAIGKAFTKNVWKVWSSVLQGDTPAKPQSPGVGFHSWVAGLPRYQKETGYVIVERQLGVNRCMRQRDLRNDKHVKPGRRQSSIVAYPMSDNPDTIVIVTYVTLGDHLQYLQPRRIPALYHLGRHGNLGNPWRHVVRVEWAAQQTMVPEPSGPGQCGQDSPAGVVYPDRLDIARDPQDLVVKAYDSVLKHIENVLR